MSISVARSESRHVEGVNDLVVATRCVGNELGSKLWLVQRRICNAEHFLDEVVTLECRNVVEVSPQRGTLQGPRGNLRS